jgi:hypothetical protein
MMYMHIANYFVFLIGLTYEIYVLSLCFQTLHSIILVARACMISYSPFSYET